MANPNAGQPPFTRGQEAAMAAALTDEQLQHLERRGVLVADDAPSGIEADRVRDASFRRRQARAQGFTETYQGEDAYDLERDEYGRGVRDEFPTGGAADADDLDDDAQGDGADEAGGDGENGGESTDAQPRGPVSRRQAAGSQGEDAPKHARGRSESAAAGKSTRKSASKSARKSARKGASE